jgi:hypothetical protein
MSESGRLDYESLRGLLRPARRRDDDLDVPAKAIQKGHEANGRETTETSREPRHFGLIHTEDFGGFRLCQLLAFDLFVNDVRQPRFDQQIIGFGQTQVGKHIS